ncbi:unnamed protein product [Phaeothamnion confervicola]
MAPASRGRHQVRPVLSCQIFLLACTVWAYAAPLLITGEWGDCTATCVRSRIVFCASSDGKIVSSDNCDTLPPSTEGCHWGDCRDAATAAAARDYRAKSPNLRTKYYDAGATNTTARSRLQPPMYTGVQTQRHTAAYPGEIIRANAAGSAPANAAAAAAVPSAAAAAAATGSGGQLIQSGGTVTSTAGAQRMWLVMAAGAVAIGCFVGVVALAVRRFREEQRRGPWDPPRDEDAEWSYTRRDDYEGSCGGGSSAASDDEFANPFAAALSAPDGGQVELSIFRL